jgi:hypothetical protein
MNTQLILENRWTALVFGAVFNVMTSHPDEMLVHYTLRTLIGGVVWLGCQVAADRLIKRGKDADTKNSKTGKE